jgi:hypothetical protein
MKVSAHFLKKTRFCPLIFTNIYSFFRQKQTATDIEHGKQNSSQISVFVKMLNEFKSSEVFKNAPPLSAVILPLCSSSTQEIRC